MRKEYNEEYSQIQNKIAYYKHIVEVNRKTISNCKRKILDIKSNNKEFTFDVEDYALSFGYPIKEKGKKYNSRELFALIRVLSDCTEQIGNKNFRRVEADLVELKNTIDACDEEVYKCYALIKRLENKLLLLKNENKQYQDED